MSILLHQEKVISSAEMYKFINECKPETRWQHFTQLVKQTLFRIKPVLESDGELSLNTSHVLKAESENLDE